MKLLKMTYLAVFLGTFILFNTGCKPFESLTVQEPETVEIESATISNMSLIIQLPIHNPNFYPIKVKKLVGTLYINKNAVGKIANKETFKIPANSDKLHKLEVDVDYSDIFDSGFSLNRILRNKNLQLKLDGKLTVRSFLMKKE